MPAGPCIVCGATNYALSFGGPHLCPPCDCGIPPQVTKLKLENQKLKERVTELETQIKERK